MIIENQKDVTTAVLAELKRAPNARFREIMSAFVCHMHDFAREAQLTEEEFHAALAYVVAIGKHSSESHNEAVLIAGSLGRSALGCLLNNANHGTTETDQNLLGPFWRMHSPTTPNGGSIVRSRTPGPALFVDAMFPDAAGRLNFRSVKPAGYPIPIDGPTGELLRAQGRHNMRPAHLHFLATKEGFKTLISQLYVPDDKYIETDAQFGVTRHLLGNYLRHENEPAPAAEVQGACYSLEHTFVMAGGTAKLPRPPISAKTKC